MARNSDFTINLKFVGNKVEVQVDGVAKAVQRLDQRIQKANKSFRTTSERSRGLLKHWEKLVIVWNQSLELVRKLGFAFQQLKVPLF
jgi:hypothetical protein